VNAETRERLIEAGAKALVSPSEWEWVSPVMRAVYLRRAAVVLDAFLEAGFGEGG
jgi:hypothetical protein